MTPDREREILAHAYGANHRITVLAGRWATEADGQSVNGGSLVGSWKAYRLEYWPKPDELIITPAEAKPLLDRKLFSESLSGGITLISTAQGRDAWRRMGAPMPEVTNQ